LDLKFPKELTETRRKGQEQSNSFYDRAYDKSAHTEDNWEENNQKGFNLFI